METRKLTARQLLILVFTACFDAGYDLLPKQKVVDTIRELRNPNNPLLPELHFISSGMKHGCSDLTDAMSGLHMSGMITLNAMGGTITIADAISSAEVFKPLHDADRVALSEAMAPYISTFMGHLTRPDKNSSKPKLDPQQF